MDKEQENEINWELEDALNEKEYYKCLYEAAEKRIEFLKCLEETVERHIENYSKLEMEKIELKLMLEKSERELQVKEQRICKLEDDLTELNGEKPTKR